MLVGTWGNRTFYSLLLGMQDGTAMLWDSLAVSYKTEHTLTIWPRSVVLFGIYPNESKLTKTCTWIFIVALLLFARAWRPPRCLSVLYIQTVQYYSVQKKKWAHKSWKDTEEPSMCISERSQSEKVMYCMVPTVWPSGKVKLWRQ